MLICEEGNNPAVVTALSRKKKKKTKPFKSWFQHAFNTLLWLIYALYLSVQCRKRYLIFKNALTATSAEGILSPVANIDYTLAWANCELPDHARHYRYYSRHGNTLLHDSQIGEIQTYIKWNWMLWKISIRERTKSTMKKRVHAK